MSFQESTLTRKTGIEKWLEAFDSEYLDEFIPAGGSVIRFLSGSPETLDELAKRLRSRSEEQGLHYRFLHPSDVGDNEKPRPYHQIEGFYKGVVEGYLWDSAIQTEIRSILRANGLPVDEETPLDDIERLAESAGRDRADLQRDIEKYCTQLIKDSRMATEFRSAIVSLAKESIFHDSGTPSMPEVVTAWLHGRALPGGSAMLKRVGIYDRIRAQNARSMLVSFLRWLKIVGTPGALVTLDIRPYEKKKLTKREREAMRERALRESLLQGRPSAESLEIMESQDIESAERFFSDRQFLLMLDLLRHFLDEVEAFPGFALIVLTTDGFYSEDQPRNYSVYNALQTRIGQEVRDSRHPNPVAVLSHLGDAR